MDEETKAEPEDEARPADEVSAETAATTEPSTPAVEPAPTVPATEPSTAVVEPVAEPGPGRPRRHRVRRVATAVLVVLTALFTLFSVIGVWVHRSVYNEGEFTSIVTPVSEDPQVLDPLATYLTVQAIEALGLQDRVNSTLQAIGAALPGGVGDRLGALAAPLTTAAQEFVQGKVQDYLHSDEFRQTFSRLVTTVHQKLIALIKGDYAQLPNLQTGGPTVYLNTIPIVAQILRHVAQSAVDLVGLNVTVPEIPTGIVPDEARQRLAAALGVTLPENFGLVPVMSSEKLHSYQAAAKTFDNLIILLIVLAIVCFALAVILSTHRRRTLVSLGLGITAALLLGGIVLRTVIRSVVDSIGSPGGKSAADDVVNVMGHNLREVGSVVLWAAIALAVIAYLVGRPRWFMALGRSARRVSVERPEGSAVAQYVAGHYEALLAAACGLALLVLAITGLSWASGVIVGLLLAAAIWWLTALRAGERARATVPAV